MCSQNFSIILNSVPNKQPPMPLPPAPGNHSYTFCLDELDCSRYLISVKLYSLWPFVTGLFTWHHVYFKMPLLSPFLPNSHPFLLIFGNHQRFQEVAWVSLFIHVQKGFSRRLGHPPLFSDSFQSQSQMKWNFIPSRAGLNVCAHTLALQ